MSSLDPRGSVALRDSLLAMKPSDVHLAPTEELPHVWATMMEMKLSGNVVSLVAVAEGTTSLYFSNGGGIIGAGEHETVRAANRTLLTVIEKLFVAFIPVDKPLPTLDGAVSFTVLTYGGLRGARDLEKRLQEKKSPLWPAYHLGQNVITKMREATEGQKRG